MESNNEGRASLKSHHGLRQMFSGDAAKQIALVVVAGLLLLAAVWIWKQIQIRNILAKDVSERQQIRKYATDQIRQTNETHLKLLAKPFVWAVRTEMLSGNFKQINFYADEMMKEKNFQKIIVTNDKGIVVLSTNKKDQGKGFAFIGNPVSLLANTTLVDTLNDSTMVLSSPIMGFNSRLGTLIITYSFQPPVIN